MVLWSLRNTGEWIEELGGWGLESLFSLTHRVSLCFSHQRGDSWPQICEVPLLPASRLRGGVLGKGMCLCWGLVGRGGLGCGLLPICKEWFQYFLCPLGGAFDVSSERPRFTGQRRDMGTKTKAILFLWPRLQCYHVRCSSLSTTVYHQKLKVKMTRGGGRTDFFFSVCVPSLPYFIFLPTVVLADEICLIIFLGPPDRRPLGPFPTVWQLQHWCTPSQSL